MKKPLLVILSCALVIALGTAQAQTRKTETLRLSEEARLITEQKLDEFKDAAEARVRKVIASQLGDTKFVVAVEAVFNTQSFLTDATQGAGPIQLRSIPQRLEAADLQRNFSESLNQNNIRKYLSTIKVSLTVSSDLTEAQQKLLLQSTAAALKIAAGDVKIQTEKLEAPSVLQQFDETKKKVESISQEKEAIVQESRQKEIKAKLEAQQLLQEKNKLDVLVRQLQGEKDELQQKVEEASKRKKELEEELSVYQTPLGDIKKIVKGLEVPLLVLPFVLVALIVTLILISIYTRVSREKAKRLYEGIEMVSAALGKVGKNSGSNQKANSAAANAIGLQSTSSEALTRLNQPGGILNSERLQEARLSENEWRSLIAECMASWENCKQCEFLLMSEIKEWCAEGFVSQLRLVNVLAVLPAQESVRIVSLLSNEDLALLQEAFHAPLSRQSGCQVVIALARQLMLTQLSLPIAHQKFSELSLIQATDLQLAQFCLTLASSNLSEVATICCLLPSTRLVRVAAAMQKLDPQFNFEQVFAKMTQAADDTESIAELVARLREWGKTLKKADQRARQYVSQLLSNAIDLAPASLRSQFEKGIALDPILALESGRQLVTIEDFLDLEKDVIAELLEPYDAESLAKLFVGLKQELIEKFAQGLAHKTRIAAELEFKRIHASELLRRRALQQSRQIQDELISALRELISDGVVESKLPTRLLKKEAAARGKKMLREVGSAKIFMLILLPLFVQPAAAENQAATVSYSAAAARIAQPANSVTFASAIGLSVTYSSRLSEMLRAAIGYAVHLNSSSLLLHGGQAKLKYTLLGGPGRSITQPSFSYQLQRPFEFAAAIGAQYQFYDLRSVVQADGIRRKDALDLEGSAYSGAVGFELSVPISSDLNIQTSLNAALGKTIESAGTLTQAQLTLGIEKVF